MSTICVVNKIDSNITGLSFAEEACLKALPSFGAGDPFDPRWFALEPNSYSDFGGDLTTVARQPISSTRQRKKGTVTDLTAQGGFNIDFTQTNLIRLLQGFFFNDAAQKPTTDPLNVPGVTITGASNSDNSFNAASGLGIFLPRHLVKASDFTVTGNNGLHLVSTVAAGKVVVAETLVTETPVSGKLRAVGFRFGSGELGLTANSTNAVLAITGLANATGTLTEGSTSNFVNNETVTIGATVYTFKTALSTGPTVAYQVLVGAAKVNSLANLAAAVNAGAGVGTTYSVGTLANPSVTATSGASTMVVTAINGGTAGNSIASTTTSATATWGAATLAGGTASTGFLALGLQVGEFVFVGGDNVANQFPTASSTNLPGYARISAITDSALTFNDTTWTPQTDAGSGKQVDIYFGTVIKNGAKLRSYQLEQTLGSDLNGVQSQYIVGAVPNEFTLNLPTAEKINADLKFVALDNVAYTGAQGLKSGLRIAAPGEAAFNTSLDIYRVRMAIVDPTTYDALPLFGFVSTATLTITNNASPIKALGHLGGIDVSVGNFDAGGSLTAVFSNVAALAAIRANADVSLNYIVASNNAGFVFDMPLLGLGGGKLNIALNSPVEMPLTAAGAQNANGYTLLYNTFSYLPTIAMPH